MSAAAIFGPARGKHLVGRIADERVRDEGVKVRGFGDVGQRFPRGRVRAPTPPRARAHPRTPTPPSPQQGAQGDGAEATESHLRGHQIGFRLHGVTWHFEMEPFNIAANGYQMLS